MQLQLENINVCNARCVFCPYTKMERKHTRMPMDLHRSIVDQAASIPLIDHITVTGLGEPLLDPELVEKIAYTRKAVGKNVYLDVYTNGHLLTADLARQLSKAGLTLLYISMNAIDPLKRKEIMGLDDYQEVENAIRESIHAVWGQMRISVKAVVEKDLFEGDEADRFVSHWGGRYQDGGHAFMHLEGNWAGKNYKVRTTQKEACSRALTSIMVLSDGRVCLCCQDYEGEVIFGDLNNESLRDIYKSDPYVAMRMAHSQGRRSELALCKDCTMV